ncbi:hypothetical protein OG413_45835 [Streptomyces sp. NBC_01433]|uniref:hypothetical protein n=1 Tax=Streptomyces sp. NBC_01433 TaxID=2903864 RepID=UPI002254F05C|nr:hypothetical protein [Streptomyces sp. NBC_01433]MCX4682454.1 hypothetical protein [Streptomyces sp. NBC_01433]MCX4682507.1 hypothetical protein [Streptomyces sp. NBC_01433]
MEDWSPDNPFGAIQPYWLQVEGKWRTADVLGPFLGEYVTCPFCENQKGLIFETDSSRLDEMADITCTCGRKFQVLEVLGYDLQQRLAFLAGEETDPAWTAKVLAEDPNHTSGPQSPAADDEEADEPKPAPAAARTPPPRMRSAGRTENRGVVVGRGEKVTGPVRANAGSTTGARRPAPKSSPRATRRAVDEATRPAPGTRVYRNDGIVNTGLLVVGDNNRQVNVRADGKGGGQVTVDGQPVTSGGRVPRKVAARAERAVRDAVRQAGQGAGPGEVRIHGENNSVVTTTTSGDQVQVTRSTSRRKKED